MSNTIVILLENGFEEIEMMIPADVLKRVGFEVVLAGVQKTVTGSHNIKIETDVQIHEIDPAYFDCVILPGGMPGSTNLKKNPDVLTLIQKMNSAGKIIAAICAAPIVLMQAGILKGKKAAGHPSIRNELVGVMYSPAMTESSGNIITGKGPGAAYEFTAKIAEIMGKKAELDKVLADMFVK